MNRKTDSKNMDNAVDAVLVEVSRLLKIKPGTEPFRHLLEALWLHEPSSIRVPSWMEEDYEVCGARSWVVECGDNTLRYVAGRHGAEFPCGWVFCSRELRELANLIEDCRGGTCTRKADHD